MIEQRWTFRFLRCIELMRGSPFLTIEFYTVIYFTSMYLRKWRITYLICEVSSPLSGCRMAATAMQFS
jgi:hypothetical protein